MRRAGGLVAMLEKGRGIRAPLEKPLAARTKLPARLDRLPLPALQRTQRGPPLDRRGGHARLDFDDNHNDNSQCNANNDRSINDYSNV